jgi:hypothetical protein
VSDARAAIRGTQQVRIAADLGEHPSLLEVSAYLRRLIRVLDSVAHAAGIQVNDPPLTIGEAVDRFGTEAVVDAAQRVAEPYRSWAMVLVVDAIGRSDSYDDRSDRLIRSLIDSIRHRYARALAFAIVHAPVDPSRGRRAGVGDWLLNLPSTGGYESLIRIMADSVAGRAGDGYTARRRAALDAPDVAVQLAVLPIAAVPARDEPSALRPVAKRAREVGWAEEAVSEFTRIAPETQRAVVGHIASEVFRVQRLTLASPLETVLTVVSEHGVHVGAVVTGVVVTATSATVKLVRLLMEWQSHRLDLRVRTAELSRAEAAPTTDLARIEPAAALTAAEASRLIEQAFAEAGIATADDTDTDADLVHEVVTLARYRIVRAEAGSGTT